MSNVSRHGTVPALVLAIVLCGFGFWLGEAGGRAWAALPIVTGIGGSLIVALAVPGRRVKKAVVGVAAFVFYGLAYFAGISSFGRAFADCIGRAEEVRVLLREYHQIHAVYPESLTQLQSPIPCARMSRATILTYDRTGNGYTLEFGDWLVQHTASDTNPFIAHK